MLDVCRLCLGFTHVNNAIDSDKTELWIKITHCLPIKPIYIPGFPNKICDDCLEKIESIHEYFNIVISSDKKLQSVIVSGVHTLKTLYQVLERDSFKKEKDIKNEVLETNEEIPKNFSSKFTQTDDELNKVNIDLIKIHDVYIKEELSNANISDDNNMESNDTEQLCTNSDDESDDNVSLIKLVAKREVEIKFEKPINEEFKNDESNGTKDKKNLKHKLNDNDSVQAEGKITSPNVESDNNDKTVEEDKLNGKVKKVKARRKKSSVWFDDSESDPKKWQCLTCFIYLPSRMELLQHYKEHGQNQDESKQATDDTESSMVLLDTGSYLCKICKKEYVNKRAVVRHIVTVHHNERPFACNLCGTSYKLAYDILLHSRVHKAAKPMFCKFEGCEYSTVYNTALKTHHKKHEPVFKYTCDICKKGFDVKSWFEEHQNVHTGVKPFTCDVCGNSFIYSRYLHYHRKHMHKVKSAITKLVHKCETCPAQFDTRRALRKHFKEHTGTQIELCDICGKGLANKARLKIHKRIHLDVKPFACRTCGKGFVKNCTLKLHERTHTSEHS